MGLETVSDAEPGVRSVRPPLPSFRLVHFQFRARSFNTSDLGLFETLLFRVEKKLTLPKKENKISEDPERERLFIYPGIEARKIWKENVFLEKFTIVSHAWTRCPLNYDVYILDTQYSCARPVHIYTSTVYTYIYIGVFADGRSPLGIKVLRIRPAYGEGNLLPEINLFRSFIETLHNLDYRSHWNLVLARYIHASHGYLESRTDVSIYALSLVNVIKLLPVEARKIKFPPPGRRLRHVPRQPSIRLIKSTLSPNSRKKKFPSEKGWKNRRYPWGGGEGVNCHFESWDDRLGFTRG